MSHTHSCLLGFCAVLAQLLLGACSPEETKSPGGIMLVTTTDLQIPKDVSRVGIQVVDNKGVTRLGKWYTLGRSPDKTSLPATLAIESGSNDEPITIGLFAERGQGNVIALSEVTTTVPRNRVALLRMPIEWLSVGMVKPAEDPTSSSNTGGAANDAGQKEDPLFPDEAEFASKVTTCDAGKTPRAGTCEPSQVDSSTLPTFTQGQVNGGGNGSGNGNCFDTVGCFANPIAIPNINLQSCVIDSSSWATLGFAPSQSTLAQITLGMVPADGSGICGSNGCIVTLDQVADGSGWSVQGNNAIKLPDAVCRKLIDGTLRAIVATTSCPSKTPEIPNCGPWSSVDSTIYGQPINSDMLSLCWNFVAQACKGIELCRGGTQFISGVVQDDGSCTDRLDFLCDASLVRPEAAPWRQYFNDCGAAFAETSCSQLELKVRSACVEPSTSTNPKADGTACSFGQCQQGSTCYGAVPNGTGKCMPRFDAVDAAAAASGVSQHCGTSTATDTLLPIGACKTNYVCDRESQNCLSPGAINATCSNDGTCQPDLVCVKGKCASPVTVDKTCSDDQECGPGLHCISANNRQQCRGPGKSGESCKVVATDQQAVLWQENLCDLRESLRCDPGTSTCGLARLAAKGNACSTLISCAGGYCLRESSTEPVTSGTCTAYHADGTACDSTAQCGPPAECIQKQCRLRPVFGCSAITMQSVPGGAIACSNGHPPCDAGCVDLTTDRNNCGQCNFACAAGAQCVNGNCTCPPGQIPCEGICTAANTDANNCGDCNVRCATGQTCSLGLCTGCSSGLTACETSCVNTLDDPAHCGDCTNVCPTGSNCVSGKCQGTTGSGGSTGSGGNSQGAGGQVAVGGTTGTGGSTSVGGSSQSGSLVSDGGTGAVTDTKTSVSVGGTVNPATTVTIQPTGGSSSTGTTTIGAGGTVTNGGAVSTSTSGAGGFAGAVTTGGGSSVGAGGVGTATGGVGPATGGVGPATGGVGTATGGVGPAAGGVGPATGGTAPIAGTTGAGGATYAQCPLSDTSSTGGAASSIPPLVVTTDTTTGNLYVTSGDGVWHGYVLLATDSLGSTISPPTPTMTSTMVPEYCTTGTVMPGDLTSNPTYAGFGFYLQQDSATQQKLSISPASAGVNIQVVNNLGSPLFVQIADSVATTWCAAISGSGGYIPWTAFNTRCWNGSGSPYRYEQIQSVAIVAAPISSSVSTNFDYCLVNIGESGSLSQELVNADGWVGGDANLTTDDPFGIQGWFWASGDNVAYTAPTGNPCTGNGCCIQGQTILDSTYEAWGGSIGLDLGYFPNAQADNIASVCRYRGSADCFDMVFAGDTGGNRLQLQARSTPDLLPDGEQYPLVELPEFSNGWSGRMCLADLQCDSASPHCVVSAPWYSIWAHVVGAEQDSAFNVCLTSLKAVKNN